MVLFFAVAFGDGVGDLLVVAAVTLSGDVDVAGVAASCVGAFALGIALGIGIGLGLEVAFGVGDTCGVTEESGVGVTCTVGDVEPPLGIEVPPEIGGVPTVFVCLRVGNLASRPANSTFICSSSFFKVTLYA